MSQSTRPAAPVALELPNMTINGYTGTLILTGETGADLVGILRAMQQAGMTQAAPVVSAAPAASGPPICPTHQKPMRESRKPGTWFCSAKVGEGYCDHKVKA